MGENKNILHSKLQLNNINPPIHSKFSENLNTIEPIKHYPTSHSYSPKPTPPNPSNSFLGNPFSATLPSLLLYRLGETTKPIRATTIPPLTNYLTELNNTPDITGFSENSRKQTSKSFTTHIPTHEIKQKPPHP